MSLLISQQWRSLTIITDGSALAAAKAEFLAKEARDRDEKGEEEESPEDGETKDPLESDNLQVKLVYSEG